MRRPGINVLVAAAIGAGISVYTFLPLIQARELERAKKAGESTETPERSASSDSTVKMGTQSEVEKK